MKFRFIDGLRVRWAVKCGRRSIKIDSKLDKSLNASHLGNVPHLSVANSKMLFILIKDEPLSKNNLKTKLEEILMYYKIVKVRGLTRWLSVNLIGEASKISESALDVGRTILLINLIKYRQEWMPKLRGRVHHKFLDPFKVSNQKTFYANDYIRYEMPVVFQNGKLYILHQGFNQSRIKFSETSNSATFLDSFVRRNSRLFLDYMYSFCNPRDYMVFLRSRYPALSQEIRKFKKIDYQILKDAGIGFDDVLNSSTSGVTPWQTLSNCEIWHQRFIIKNNRWLIPDSTMNPLLPFVAGQWQFVKRIQKNREKCIIKLPGSTTIQLSKGIILSPRLDENWYHLLLDSVPRLFFMRRLPKNIPLLIRDDIPNTSKIFLRKISQRKVIEIPNDSRIRLEELYLVTARSTIYDSTLSRGQRHPLFSKNTIRQMKSWILASYDTGSSTSTSVKKYYIQRIAKYRNLLNQPQICSSLESIDVSVIKPDSKFFKNQVRFFSKANLIVTPGGATVANIIFLSEGSTVVVLRSWRNETKNIWKALSKICGLNHVEIQGIPVYFGLNRLRRTHSDFYIREKKVLRTLSKLKA